MFRINVNFRVIASICLGAMLMSVVDGQASSEVRFLNTESSKGPQVPRSVLTKTFPTLSDEIIRFRQENIARHTLKILYCAS